MDSEGPLHSLLSVTAALCMYIAFQIVNGYLEMLERPTMTVIFGPLLGYCFPYPGSQPQAGCDLGLPHLFATEIASTLLTTPRGKRFSMLHSKSAPSSSEAADPHSLPCHGQTTSQIELEGETGAIPGKNATDTLSYLKFTSLFFQ